MTFPKSFLVLLVALTAEFDVSRSFVDPILQVEVYYEGLCYNSQEFVGDSLPAAWRALGDRLNVTLVPWGAAAAEYDEARQRWNISCQHGPVECRSNKLQGCAAQLASQSARDLMFSFCMMKLADEVQCANSSGIDHKSLLQCVLDSEEDTMMVRKYGLKTEHLDPPLTVIPTIVIDGRQVDYYEVMDFLEYFCEHYSERAPDVCVPEPSQ